MVKEQRPLEIGTEYWDSHPFISNLVANGFQPYMVLKEGGVAISNANKEFTLVAGTLTHLRVTTTGSYKKVAIVSASANDDGSANKHCRAVKTWGVDSNNYLRVEEITTNGATSASSSNSYFELGDMYGSSFGSGGDDAAGAIHIGYVGKVTNEILEIPANARTCISSRVPIPKAWRAKILSVNVYPQDADVALSSGVMVYPHYYDENDCKEEDSTLGKVSVMRDGAKFDSEQWPRIYGNDTTYSLLEFLGNRVKNSETWTLSARIVLWATHACSANRRRLEGDLT